MHLKVNFRVVRTRTNKKGELPIYYRISLKGERAELFSGYHILPEYWNEATGAIIPGNDAVDAIGNCLEADRIKFLRIFSEYQLAGVDINPKDLIDRFRGRQQTVPTLLVALSRLIEQFKEQLGSQGYSQGRYKRYLVFKGKIERFLQSRYKAKDFDLGKLSNQFIADFDRFLKVEDGLDLGTVGVYVKILKKLVRFAISNGWMENDPFAAFRCKTKRVDRPFLNDEELATLESKDFPSDRLSIVRDLFLFSCYTGLSYIDLAKLTPQDIVTGIDGKNWLSFHRKKTGQPCRIPLLPKAEEIADRYRDYPESCYKNRLLPVRANQKLNEYLKEIADLCGIRKHITFHVARHTFATTILLNKGISIETASKLLGHTNLRTTQIYARMTDTRIADEMRLLTQKLNKK